LQGNVAEIADESLEHFGAADLTVDLRGAKRFDQRIPVGVLRIEFGQGSIDVIHTRVGDHGRVAQARVLAGKTADKLDGDGNALVRVVQSRDFQFRQIEPFAQHVDADDDTTVEAAQCG